MYRSVAADISQQLEQDGQPDLPPPISDKQRAEAQDAASWVQSGSIARERDQVSSDLAHIRRVMGVAQGIGSHFGRLNQIGIERGRQLQQEAQYASTLPQPTPKTYLSDTQRQQVLAAMPYINGRVAKGFPVDQVVSDVLGSADMDTIHAASALLNEPARITQHYTDKAVVPVADNTIGRIPGVGPEAAKLVEGAVPFAIESKVPVVGGPLVGQQLLFQIASTLEDYQQGKIDAKTAAVQLAPIVGGAGIGPLAKVITKGARAAGVGAREWVRSPEGQQALRDAVDTLKAKGSQAGSKLAEERGSLGVPPEEPAGDLPGRTPEESAAATEKYQAQAAKDQANKLQKMEFHTLLEDWHDLSRSDPAAAASYEAELTRRGITNPESSFREYRMQPLTPEMPGRLKTPAERSAETGAAVPVEGQAGAPPPSQPLAPPRPSQEAPQPAGEANGELPPVEAPKATQGEVWQFNPSPEELTHLHNLIDHGDWTQTPGARIGARSIVKKLLNGEAPSDKQFAMLQRVLTSKQPTVEVAPKAPAAPKLKQPKIPIAPTAEIFDINAAGKGATQRRATMAARGAQPDLSPVEPMGGEPFPFPKSDAGALQPALADNLTDAYVGAISVGKNGSTSTPQGAFQRMLAIAKMAPDVMTLPKALKAGIDIGWAGRNGWRLFPRNPREWTAMWKKQFTALRSSEGAAKMDAETKAFPNFKRSQEAERPLAYLQEGAGNPETAGEEFTSRITKHLQVTLFGHELGVAGFERAYVHPGNWMRQAVLDKQVARLVHVNKVPVSDADFQLLIDNLNNATLRGNTAWLKKVPHASEMASMLFSAKGQVSGPQFAMDAIRAVINGGGKYSPEARKIIGEQFGAYVALGMSTLGIAAATGWGLNQAGKPDWVSVDLNHNSPTFGQISIGGMRWNYWGADQSLVRTAIQVATGKQQKPGLPALSTDRRRLASNFAGNKVAPGLPKFLWDELVNGGKTKNSGIFHDSGMNINTPLGFINYLFDQVSPIGAESGVSAYKDLGPAAVPFAVGADVSGLSTSTYDNSATPDQLKDADRRKVTDHLNASGFDKIESMGFQSDFWRKKLSTVGGDASQYDNFKDYRQAYIDRWTKTGVDRGLSVGLAEQKAREHFDSAQAVKDWHTGLSNARLAFWKQHPDLLYEAFTNGVEELNKSEQKVLDDYLKAAATR